MLTAFCWALALLMLALGAYVAWWYIDLGRIQRAGERYAGLYGGEATATPTAAPAPAVTPEPTVEPTSVATPKPVATTEPTPEVTAEPTPVAKVEPTPEITAEPTPVATPEPVVTAKPTPEVTAEPTPEATVEPTPVITAEPTPVATPEPSPAPTEAPEGQPLTEALSVPMAVPSPEPTEAPLPVLTPEQVPPPLSASASELTEALSVPMAVPSPEPTEAPLPVLTPEQVPPPLSASASELTEALSVPMAVPSPEPTEVPLPVITFAPTAEPTPVQSSVVTPAPFGADMPLAGDVLIPTPGADTLVYAVPTPPPPQASFDALLALNPETVGFLEIEDLLSLPVAQRENDNEYYLSHTFEGDQAQEGALFLDGMNRLVPEDDCLIVYGHNMKNKTMFGKLNSYGDVTFLRHHSVIRFDTLYENRRYVAFAAFSASMKPGDARYFDVRQFIFDEAEFDKFVLKLQGRSLYKSPIDVRYGDRLLLLVTCDYSRTQGRFILALRQLRPDESEADVQALAMTTAAK